MKVQLRIAENTWGVLVFQKFAKLCGASGFWENVLDSFSCFYIEIAYSNYFLWHLHTQFSSAPHNFSKTSTPQESHVEFPESEDG